MRRKQKFICVVVQFAGREDQYRFKPQRWPGQLDLFRLYSYTVLYSYTCQLQAHQILADWVYQSMAHVEGIKVSLPEVPSCVCQIRHSWLPKQKYQVH